MVLMNFSNKCTKCKVGIRGKPNNTQLSDIRLLCRSFYRFANLFLSFSYSSFYSFCVQDFVVSGIVLATWASSSFSSLLARHCGPYLSSSSSKMLDSMRISENVVKVQPMPIA